MYLVCYLKWDRTNKTKLFACSIDDTGVTFYCNDLQEHYSFDEIQRIEVFPSGDNIRDPDFMTNFYSPGLRVYAGDKTFLVLNKISNFHHLSKKLRRGVEDVQKNRI